jgi:hypothetical protein
MRYLILFLSLSTAFIWYSFNGDKLHADIDESPVVLYKEAGNGTIAATIYCTSKSVMNYLRNEIVSNPVFKSHIKTSDGSSQVYFKVAGQKRQLHLGPESGCLITQIF